VELTTGEVARVLAAKLHGADVIVRGAAIDSRRIAGGELFVPIVAERDGHDFVLSALAAGAAAYLTAHGPLAGVDAPAIEVSDTAAALLELGRHARSRLPERVVAITGSVGKTSTKDLLRAVLSGTWHTVANEASFNNELGVPLTLLGAPDAVEAVVVEMGARGPGHIRTLCDVARPTVGVVTVVQGAHLELFGDLEAVAAAKGELVEALASDGVAVLNADDHRVAAMASRTEATVVTFGEAGDVRAEGVRLDAELRPSFHLRSPWGDADVALAARGRHQVVNALASAATGLALGVHPEAVAAALHTAALSSMRMQLDVTASGLRVLNDAYNANPTSMRAALEALAALGARRRVAVLGVMAELGPGGDAEHLAIAAQAAELGIRVVAVDAAAYGPSVEHVASVDAALASVADLGEGDAVLVKGSRVAALERVAARLANAGT
jgi:UDP-N-acetylmuramoyl-tripeptide--D-alanyl-D-alanine ligase